MLMTLSRALSQRKRESSVPTPHAEGVAAMWLRLEEAGPAVTDGAQQGDPVQQLAGDVAGSGHALRRGLVQQVVGLPLAQPAHDLVGPGLVGGAVAVAAGGAKAADVVREIAAGQDGHGG